MSTTDQTWRILVVDDDPDSLKIVQSVLEWAEYQVELAESGQAAIDKIGTWSPHLVLLDINMPGLNGLETLKWLRSRADYISTILVSGKADTADVIAGLDAGADDYICKPFDQKELLSRVRCQLRINVLHEELKRANDKLQELVDIDDLTGLFNMRSLYKKLDHELHRAARYNRSICVLMLDMDDFKTVNDQNDHLFGSFVLAEMGRIIKESVRKIDFAARYGGDEFLIVLTEIDLEGARAFTERLRANVEQNEFANENSKMFLTVSIGFAITELGESALDARSLVRHADQALYAAKNSGKNRVHYCDFSKGQNKSGTKVLKIQQNTQEDIQQS